MTAAAVRDSPDIDPEIKKALAGELVAAEGDKAEIEAWVDREFQVRKFAQTGTDAEGGYRMMTQQAKEAKRKANSRDDAGRAVLTCDDEGP